MKKGFVVLVAVLLSCGLAVAKDKAAGAKSKSISGWISDEKCAAKGTSADHADCAKKCEEAGKKLVVVADKGHTVYQVDNQDALKGHEGHHVKVTGQDNNGTLHVDKVQMLAQGSSAKNKGK